MTQDEFNALKPGDVVTWDYHHECATVLYVLARERSFIRLVNKARSWEKHVSWPLPDDETLRLGATAPPWLALDAQRQAVIDAAKNCYRDENSGLPEALINFGRLHDNTDALIESEAKNG